MKLIRERHQRESSKNCEWKVTMIQTNTTALRNTTISLVWARFETNKNPLNSARRKTWFWMVNIPQEKSRWCYILDPLWLSSRSQRSSDSAVDILVNRCVPFWTWAVCYHTQLKSEERITQPFSPWSWWPLRSLTQLDPKYRGWGEAELLKTEKKNKQTTTTATTITTWKNPPRPSESKSSQMVRWSIANTK